MARKRKRRPNWPYRLAWATIIASIFLYITIEVLVASRSFGSRVTGVNWQLAIVSSLLNVTIASWFVAFGASIGSFLNVVAYRLPIKRGIGGNSGCPYCGTPIDSLDNIPVLAWIQLRGRCRACRLPISIQYPLVEFTVAAIFFIVYVTEFATGGSNLPSGLIARRGAGLLRVGVNVDVVMQLSAYLFALSGLVAAALIAVKRNTVPLKLYFWSAAPLVVLSLIQPKIIVEFWRDVAPESVMDLRMQAVATLVCGAAAGVAVARLVAPLVYRGFDQRLLANDPASRGARQFIGAMSVAGALVGWQAIVPLAWAVVLCALLSIILLRRYRSTIGLGDLTVWVWLGLVVFRANWSLIYRCSEWIPDSVPTVFVVVAGGLTLAPVCIAISALAGHADVPGDAEADDSAGKNREASEGELSKIDSDPAHVESRHAERNGPAAGEDSYPSKEDGHADGDDDSVRGGSAP